MKLTIKLKRLPIWMMAIFMGMFTIVVKAQDAPTHVLFTNVTVWDGTSEKTIKADVLVENNLIKEVKVNIKAPNGATVIDGKGTTLMPGLIEGHGHLQMNGTSVADIENNRNWEELAVRSAVKAKAALMSGFTTWRDAGGMGTGLKKSIDAGYNQGSMRAIRCSSCQS